MLTKLSLLTCLLMHIQTMDCFVTHDNNIAEDRDKILLPSDTILLPDFEIRDSAVLLYYALINAAEASVLDSNFVEAMDHYLKAFRLKYPFWRDYRNAKTVLKYADTKDSLLTKQFLELTKPADKSSNPITSQIDSIFRLDQESRMNKAGKIGAQDSSNHRFVLHILQNNPISEQNIGINCMVNLENVLLHLSRYKHFSDLIPLLADQVSEGNFNNRTFATLLDGYHEYHISRSKTGTVFLTQSIYPIFSKFLLPDWDTEYILEIDRKRAKIGLEGIQDQYKKQFYNFKYGYREYEFYQFFTWFPAEEFCTEEEKISYLEKEKTMIKEFMEKEKNLMIWTK